MLAAKTILIIHSFAVGSVWSTQMESGFIEELEKSGFVGNFESVYFLEEKKDELLQKVDKKRPSAILITGELACEHLVDSLSKKKIPTFFTSVPRTETPQKWLNSDNKNNVTGVFEKTNIEKSLDIIEKIMGKKAKAVGILVGGPLENMKNVALMVKYELRSRPEIILTIEHAEFYEAWKLKLVSLNEQNEVLIPLLPYAMRDSSAGKETDWNEVGTFMKSHVTKPTIGLSRMDCQMERMISISRQPRDFGIQAARMVYDHLVDGITLNHIPIEFIKTFELEINKKEASRLGFTIPEDVASHAKII